MKKGKANEKRKREKVNKAKDEEVNGQGRKKAEGGTPAPCRVSSDGTTATTTPTK